MSKAFEEWKRTYCGSGDNDPCVNDMEAAWNAALEHAEKLCKDIDGEDDIGNFAWRCARALAAARQDVREPTKPSPAPSASDISGHSSG